MSFAKKSVYRSMFDPTITTSAAPISVSGADFRFYLISDGNCEALQRSRAEMLDSEWRAIVHPDDITDPSNKQARMLATGEPYDVTCRVLRADGRWLLGQFHVRRIEGRYGLPSLVQTSARFEELPALQPVPAIDPTMALVEYLQTFATELAGLAGKHELDTLKYLLSMVSLEAAEHLQRKYPNITTLATRSLN